MTWVLVLFLKMGYSGGVVYVPMHTKQACITAQVEMRNTSDYEGSYCLDTTSGKSIFLND
jgi:hypothetical protein